MTSLQAHTFLDLGMNSSAYTLNFAFPFILRNHPQTKNEYNRLIYWKQMVSSAHTRKVHVNIQQRKEYRTIVSLGNPEIATFKSAKLSLLDDCDPLWEARLPFGEETDIGGSIRGRFPTFCDLNHCNQLGKPLVIVSYPKYAWREK